jgi:dTDP-4-dehydrorhamnose reductase
MSRLDVREAGSVQQAVTATKAEIVIHLAAETDLEICEADAVHALRTNTLGTENVALACRNLGATMVYVSTAGVFDGEKKEPYTELDVPRPINVYGRTKLDGETLVRREVANHFVIRAGWMVGGWDRDHKFVAKILAQLDAGAAVIHAVADKFGTPTYTEDFAQNLLDLLGTDLFGLYHMVCLGEGTRYDVARAIVELAVERKVEVVPVTSDFFAAEYPTPRPRSEMMRNYMLDLRGLNRMRHWREALADYLGGSRSRVKEGGGAPKS